MTAALLQVDELQVAFRSRRGWFRREMVPAVRGVSFSIAERETFGLVGESGCGKTTTGRAILRLVAPSGGSIRFEGSDIGSGRHDVPLSYRRGVQVVFQDPYSSLNPRLTIGETLEAALARHGAVVAQARTAKAAQLLQSVNLAPTFSRAIRGSSPAASASASRSPARWRSSRG